jgi:hypothetical protein
MAVRKGETLLLTKAVWTHNKGSCYLFDSAERIGMCLFAICILNMLALGCNRQPVSLQEQVRKYWEARIQGDVEQTYALEAPGTVEKLAYQKKLLKSPVIYRSYTIQSIKEDGDKAEAELRMEYILPGLSRPASSTMVDRWVKVRGQWYHNLPAGDSGTTKEERG